MVIVGVLVVAVVVVVGRVVVTEVVRSAAEVLVVVEKKKVFSYSTMGGVILRLGALPEPWESENTSEDLRRS